MPLPRAGRAANFLHELVRLFHTLALPQKLRVRRSIGRQVYPIWRMAAFLDPLDWATWLGEGGNDPVAANAACKITEGVRWTMTNEGVTEAVEAGRF